MATTTVTLEQYVTLEPQIAKDIAASWRVTVNAGALETTREARRMVRRTVGMDQKLSGMPNSKKIQPYYLAAKSDQTPIAILKVRGPWQMIEHPRKGGYKIRPKKGSKGKKALSIGGEAFGGATGGAILNPPRPVTRTYLRAPVIIRRIAADTMDEALRHRIERW